ncbi:hypothetical protein V7161_08965 [Neobacillus drentensis]
MEIISLSKEKAEVIGMRSSDKGMNIQSMNGRLFGVDFHDFIEKEQHASSIELASEFGLTMSDVRKLKKLLGRS